MVLSLLIAVVLLYIAVVDAKTMEIPDECSFLLGILAFISIWVEPEISMTDRIIGACCISVPMYMLCLLISNAFGGGDIELTFVMGFYLGWENMLVGMFLAVLVGGMQASNLLIGGKVKAGENAHMAFGPALCVGMIIAMFWGEELLSWYIGRFY